MRLPKTLSASVLVVAMMLGGCSSAPEWHPVTTDESQQLAITRFNNFDAGSRAFATQTTVDDGTELSIQGWYDFAVDAGYARVSGKGFAPQDLIWTPHEVAIRPADPAHPDTPGSVASDHWVARLLDPSASILDALLASFEAVSNDRPDNPLLLQQQGALWLEQVTHEPSGETADVFATPPSDDVLSPDDQLPTPETSTVKLWLNETGLLLRMELLFPAGWTSIDFSPADGDAPELAEIPEVLLSLVQEGDQPHE